MTLNIRRRLRDNFQYYAGVTWSRDEDNDSNERNFAGIQAEDVNNLDLNYGYANRDQAWRAFLSGLYQLPWWDIQLSGAFRYLTGSPWNIQAGSDVNGDTNNVDRPTINGIHVERNSERQPDYWTVDLRIGKPFKIGDVGDILIFAECFNLTDEANWSVPTNNMSWGSANRSTPSSASFGQETTPGTPRTFQFGIRFDF